MEEAATDPEISMTLKMPAPDHPSGQLMRRLFATCMLVFSVGVALAGDMRDCVQLTHEHAPGQNKDRPVLINTCSARVFIFWCHVGGGAYECKAPKHYRQGRYFSPGERYHNSYTLPEHVSVDYGACSGNGMRVDYGANGAYRCPPETAGIKGKGPQRGQVRCSDGRRVEFDWYFKGENESMAVIQLEDGAVTLPRADYRAFEKDPGEQPPEALVNRLCKRPPPAGEAGSRDTMLNDLKDWTRNKADALETAERDACLKNNNAGADCRRFREVPRSTPQAGGNRG